MSKHGLNTMTKQELRKKLAADAERWIQENGAPERYAAQTSPHEHFRICGYKYKRKVLKPRDAGYEQYQAWLREQQRLTAS